MPVDSLERLLTTRELAGLLGFTPRQVIRLWQEKRIPGYLIGERTVRFRASEVEAWLAQQKRNA